MDKKEFSITMQFLSTAYNKELNDDTLKVWYEFFKIYDVETFKNGIIQAISQCKYYPSIAEVKEIIAMQNTPQVNHKADDEWEKVRESVRKYGMYNEDEALASLEPLTRNIVKRIGFKDICMMNEDNRYNLRSAFVKSYNSEKEDLIRYKNAINNDTEDMKLIHERNKEIISDLALELIKRIDCDNEKI